MNKNEQEKGAIEINGQPPTKLIDREALIKALEKEKHCHDVASQRLEGTPQAWTDGARAELRFIIKEIRDGRLP